MAKLLLVDDDDSTRLICRRLFRRIESPQLEVDEAANGEEAIALLKENAYDCVLSDYRMGQVSGIDVLAYAAERQPEAKRVLMSGFADPAIVEAARERARIHAFVEKPFSIPEFDQALRRDVLGLLGRSA